MGNPVTCTACGKRNRVPFSARGKAVCGACGAALPWIIDAGDADFDRAVASTLPVIIDLWAPWCGPCRIVSSALEQLAAERAGALKVVKVNVDDAPDVARRFGVQSIPTLLLIVDGAVVARQVGALPASALASWLDAGLRQAA